MHVQFVTRESGPERLVCEAEIVFDAEDGPLAGMKIVGLSIWDGPDGDKYVTFPARAFGAGSERKFFDYLRTADGVPGTARRVKAWILTEYAEARAAA
jgi:hypothetical protein